MSYRRSIVRAVRASGAVAALALATPMTVHAQALGDGFMFGRPNGSVTFRGGLARPSTGSDVYSFARDNLTLGRSAFVGGSVGGNIDVRLTNRFSLQFNGSYSGRSADSEFRDWVDNNDKPILQTTTLRRVPVMAGLRYDLVAPGRSLGRLAWVPSKVVPYVAAGGGAVWYDFEQTGDFVDFKTLDVFNDQLKSSSWTSGGYGALGVDFALHPAISLNTEARYDRASAHMSNDFSGFDHIDLSGVAVTVGLSFRF